MFRSDILSASMKVDLKNKKGFTLIEVIISLSIFIIVMTISAGAILSIVDSNRKARAIKSGMDNLGFALESFSRNARVGSGYSCDLTGAAVGTLCPDGSISFSHIDAYDVAQTRRIGYQFTGGRLYRYINGGSPVTLTSPEITIDSSTRFYFTKTENQPRVIVAVKGTTGARKYQTEFSVQTSITQRKVE